MPRYKDISGERYGRLVAIERVGKDKHGNSLWRCQCDCGGEAVVRMSALRYGDTRSCGCLHEKRLEGKRFGRLTAIKKVGVATNRHNIWECQCDCGNTAFVLSTELINGHTKSCGCLMKETVSRMMSTHGLSDSRLYTVWCGVVARCENPAHKSYKNYGGRGIKICSEWRNDFTAFHDWALANGYDENAPRGQCTIDRIDVNGDYEPNNCRWVTQAEQMKNTRPRKRGYKRGHYKKRSNCLKGVQ